MKHLDQTALPLLSYLDVYPIRLMGHSTNSHTLFPTQVAPSPYFLSSIAQWLLHPYYKVLHEEPIFVCLLERLLANNKTFEQITHKFSSHTCASLQTQIHTIYLNS